MGGHALDEIRIENLECFGYHGVYDFEKEKGQPFFVNAVLYTDTSKAGKTDDLTLSTDYGKVCHFIHDWMKEHVCNLLEKVAEDLAREILLHFTLIEEILIEIRKPQAPIGLPFGSVSVKIHRGWHTAYLSIGSNMGDKEAYLNSAVLALEQHPCMKNVKCSDWLITKPYGGVEQDDFVNGAVQLKTLLSPWELLEELHRIEAEANRERKLRWGPRTLDLDIIFYDKEVLETEDLILPHVDMQNRFFVLKPLSQLNANYRHPILQKTVAELLKDVEGAMEKE